MLTYFRTVSLDEELILYALTKKLILYASTKELILYASTKGTYYIHWVS